MKKKIIKLLMITLIFSIILCACGEIKEKTEYDYWLESGQNGSEEEFNEWLEKIEGLESEFLSWLKLLESDRAFEIFMEYNSDYPGDKKQWDEALSSNKLYKVTITFKAQGEDDMVLSSFCGFLNEIPPVHTKTGNKGVWDVTDFSEVTGDIVVNAVYETIGLGYSIIGNGEIEITRGRMDESIEEVFIPSAYMGMPITSIGEKAFSKCERLRTIKIPDSIKVIGNQSFEQCKSLEEVNLPNSVTSIGIGAFEKCISLMAFKVPDKVTHISDSTFNSCPSLSYIVLPDGIKSIGNSAFFNCSNLLYVNPPDSLVEIGTSAFEGCKNLSFIAIPNGIIGIKERTFFGCANLSNLNIPNSVTSIGAGAFEGCGNIKSITIPSSVINMDCPFANWTESQTIYVAGRKEKPVGWTADWSGNATVVWEG